MKPKITTILAVALCVIGTMEASAQLSGPGSKRQIGRSSKDASRIYDTAMRKNGRLASWDAYAMARDFKFKGDAERATYWMDVGDALANEERERALQMKLWEVENKVKRVEREIQRIDGSKW